MRNSTIVAGCLLLFRAGGLPAQQVVGSPLFYVHSTQVYEYGEPFTGFLNIAEDWSVASDATTSSIVRYDFPQAGFGPFVQSRIGVAPAFVFQPLVASFAASHVGVLAGNCRPYPAGPGASFRMELTWYGRHGRVNSFVVANDFTTPCPAEIQTLLSAVAYFEKVMVDPDLPVW
jgi:hypothetical protein